MSWIACVCLILSERSQLKIIDHSLNRATWYGVIMSLIISILAYSLSVVLFRGSLLQYYVTFKWNLIRIKIMPINVLLLQDVSKLTPLSQEIISRQATINIGKRTSSHHSTLFIKKSLVFKHLTNSPGTTPSCTCRHHRSCGSREVHSG